MLQHTPTLTEDARLTALCGYGLLGTPPEPEFDDLAGLAADVCGTPLAAVTLVDESRLWLKARVGLDVAETPREISFCRWALDRHDPLVVPDARRDPRFADNPLVTGEPGIRFYAGAPLITRDGHVLGTLCVMDRRPRRLGPRQLHQLTALAQQVMAQMELRRQTAQLAVERDESRRAEQARREGERHLQSVTDNVPILIARMDTDVHYLFANRAYQDYLGVPLDQVIGRPMSEVLGDEAFAVVRPYIERTLAGERLSYEAWLSYRTIGLRYVRVSYIPERDSDGTVTGFVLSATDMTDRQRMEGALRKQHNLLEAVIEGIGDALFVKDLEGRYTFINAAGADCLGRPVAEIVGRDDRQLVAPDLAEQTQAHDRRILESGGVETYEDTEADAYGTRTYLSTKGVFRDVAGRVAGLFGLSRDITERKALEVSLRESKRRLRLAVESGRLGTWEVDLTTGQTLNVSATAKAHFGLPPEAGFSEDVVFGAVHPDDRAFLREAFGQALADRRGYAVEFRVVWPDGSVHWLHDHATPLSDEAGRPVRMVGVSQDVTERKAQEAEREALLSEMECLLEEAVKQADHDPLTGLLNHRTFHKRLDEEADRAQRTGQPLAVVVMDLNNFKFFNDCYGHPIGDEALRTVANALRGCCRSYDSLARFGGDEFALLMPGVDAEGGAGIARRLDAALDGLSLRPPGYEADVPLTLSFGVAMFPDEAPTRADAVALADARLYAVKSGGGDQAVAKRVRAFMTTSLDGFSMLDALVTAVDNKDRYTRKHSEDVLRYCLQIAGELGLDEEARHALTVAALIHDVGKIGVPDYVLRKPGKLTDEEFAAIRQHPMMGAIIVQAVPGLEETLDAVRHHHERWDGGGYPFGLRAEETPLAARLMAVADAFSAMTTDRPYRQGMGETRALQILTEGAGIQWDPSCVAAFLRARQADQPRSGEEAEYTVVCGK